MRIRLLFLMLCREGKRCSPLVSWSVSQLASPQQPSPYDCHKVASSVVLDLFAKVCYNDKENW